MAIYVVLSFDEHGRAKVEEVDKTHEEDSLRSDIKIIYDTMGKNIHNIHIYRVPESEVHNLQLGLYLDDNVLEELEEI